MRAVNCFETDLTLPAYSNAGKTSHLFEFNLVYKPATCNVYQTECELGESLALEFHRVINILYRSQCIWKILVGEFYIKGKYPGFKSGDTASSGLGIAISLFNLIRSINQSRQASGIVGTGFIRSGGNIEMVDGIEQKTKSACKYNKVLLTANEIFHVRSLDIILARYC